MPRRSQTPRRRALLLALAAACLPAACDRDVAVVGDDPLAVEAANAGMDALLLDGPTARRVAAHRLTPERVERWFAAQEALDAQAADDPTLAGRGTVSAADGDDAIERAVAALEDRPGAEAAIDDAGLSVEEFVLTGLALHQALTASAPSAPAAIRRLAARNVRFVSEHADLLAQFRTQRPTYVAEAPAEDSTWWYDPFADSLVYGVAPAAAPVPDTASPPDPPPPDSLPPDSLARRDTVPVPRRDTLRPPPAPVVPVAPPPPVAVPPIEPPPA